MSIHEFNRFYREAYLPIYSDLVGYIGDKPRQVLIEIENLLTHLVRYLDESVDESQRASNLKQAYNHLIRVTIDCHKILWVVMKDDLLEMEDIATGLAEEGISPAEFYFIKQEFKRLSVAARNKEMELVGKNPQDCLPAYEEVIYYAWQTFRDVKKKLIKASMNLPEPVGDEVPADFRSGNKRFGLSDTMEEGISEL